MQKLLVNPPLQTLIRFVAFRRFLLLVLLYSVLIALSLWASIEFRFDFDVPTDYQRKFWIVLPLVLLVKLCCLGGFRQFGSLLTYFSLSDAKRLVLAMTIAFVIMLSLWYGSNGEWMLPRGVVLSDFFISVILFAGLRTSLRVLREGSMSFADRNDTKTRNIGIIGAGSSGSALFREIQAKPGLNMRVVCFIDDDVTKIGGSLHGRKILGPRRDLSRIFEHLDVSKAIIAMPTASAVVIRETVDLLNQADIEHDILPSVTQLLHHHVSVNFLRHVNPEDLLGRDAVSLDEPGLREMLGNKSVLVTGAGGSIGSELCRQIAFFSPSKLILVERSEPALFAIEQELMSSFPSIIIEACVSSVCNEPALKAVFATYRPSVVFHAAAHKHVPLMEKQPAEAIINNCLGSLNVGKLAATFGCQKMVLVSTDKAVNPTNVMGATKRVTELIWAELQERYACQGCCFSAVRFGNVLGSSGSVIPIFRRQIAAGGPITVTHPEVTRFFMSIPEAAGLILQSAFQSKGGEIFVLDMGQSIKITDMARQMIELCGLRPEEDIQITFTGLRPGEKLYEETIHSAENVTQTLHAKIMLLRPEANRQVPDAIASVRTLGENVCSLPVAEIKRNLKTLVPEYQIWEDR